MPSLLRHILKHLKFKYYVCNFQIFQHKQDIKNTEKEQMWRKRTGDCRWRVIWVFTELFFQQEEQKTGVKFLTLFWGFSTISRLPPNSREGGRKRRAPIPDAQAGAWGPAPHPVPSDSQLRLIWKHHPCYRIFPIFSPRSQLAPGGRLSRCVPSPAAGQRMFNEWIYEAIISHVGLIRFRTMLPQPKAQIREVCYQTGKANTYKTCFYMVFRV